VKHFGKILGGLFLIYNTAAEPGPGQMHMLDNVFASPQAYKTFLKTGTWPEQTVLVKENRIAESAGTLSKSGRFQTGVMNLEIHVKDSARFAGGWAFFVSPDGKADGKLMPQTANCYSCHQDHGAVDTTFVQFYPTLLGIAKDKATLSANYLKNDAAK
jgi:Cytochrome P460